MQRSNLISFWKIISSIFCLLLHMGFQSSPFGTGVASPHDPTHKGEGFYFN